MKHEEHEEFGKGAGMIFMAESAVGNNLLKFVGGSDSSPVQRKEF